MSNINGGNTSYRVGVIGCGDIGSFISDRVQYSSHRQPLPFGHAPTYASMPHMYLAACADADPDKAGVFADRWNFSPKSAYTDYREMLEKEKLDMVSIATPTPLHAEMAIAAAESGVRAIFLEKPIASNLRDAENVVATCNRLGVPLAVNHLRRADQWYRKAHQLVEEGAIGEVHSLMGLFGGGLMWSGTHMFDLLNYFAGDGEVSWMSGHLDDPQESTDPGGSAYILYQKGIRAFVNASKGNSVSFRLHVIGTDGEIIIGNYELELYRSNPEGSQREFLRYPFPQVLPAVAPMVTLVNELLDTLDGGPAPCSTGETALNALALIVGLHASSTAGSKPVRFPDGLDRDLTVISG